MKNNGMTILARALREAAMKFLLVAMVVATTAFVACSEDPTGGNENNKQEEPQSNPNGVKLPSETSKKCTAKLTTIKFNITTDAGYKMEVDDDAMLKITGNASADKAGTYSIVVEVQGNNTGNERTGNIYITVTGHSKVKVMEIYQAAPASASITDEVVKWVDQRLNDEYYWLEGYKEYSYLYDYTLPYDKFLSTSLLAIPESINGDDGYVSGGTRYLYSYITREAKTRADDRTENGLGIMIANTYFGGDNNTAIMVVEHVYQDSPAANAGLKRGDYITKVNGATIPAPHVNGIYNEANAQKFLSVRNNLEYGSGTLTIEGQTSVSKDVDYKYTITSANYEPNPVAVKTVLEFDDAVAKILNPDGKKIGYMVYLGFESDFDAELIAAMEELAAQGVTDLILDLRMNGGGSVNSATMLGSMILSEDYVGKTFATLKRNPNNKLFPAEQLNTECLITKNGLGDNNGKELPNLNLPELWVIASSSTASASEMIIKGMEGLDVPVHVVGKTTNGKNCGMDVMYKTFGEYEYTYAPITFMNYNAKGDNDYADGITPEINFDDYYSASNPAANYLSYQCYVFPLAQADWGEMEIKANEDGTMSFSGDFILYETVSNIGRGKSFLKKSTAASAGFKPAEMPTTRGAEPMRVYEVKGEMQGRSYGALLTPEAREAFDNMKK